MSFCKNLSALETLLRQPADSTLCRDAESEAHRAANTNCGTRIWYLRMVGSWTRFYLKNNRPAIRSRKTAKARRSVRSERRPAKTAPKYAPMSNPRPIQREWVIFICPLR